MAVVIFTPAASANHTLAHKVSILQGKVATLQAKVGCLRKYGLSEYLGYASYLPDGAGGLLDDGELIAGNLNVALGDTAAPDVWLVAVRDTASCRAKFPNGANPYSARVMTRLSDQRIARLAKF
ncbi:MAG: hypothetical protein ACRDNG_13965 [Gaiellaceae bacterium]